MIGAIGAIARVLVIAKIWLTVKLNWQECATKRGGGAIQKRLH